MWNGNPSIRSYAFNFVNMSFLQMDNQVVGVRLQSDGQSAEGGAEVHPGHREADQEGRM